MSGLNGKFDVVYISCVSSLNGTVTVSNGYRPAVNGSNQWMLKVAR